MAVTGGTDWLARGVCEIRGAVLFMFSLHTRVQSQIRQFCHWQVEGLELCAGPVPVSDNCFPLSGELWTVSAV